jgi:hypothetical protein
MAVMVVYVRWFAGGVGVFARTISLQSEFCPLCGVFFRTEGLGIFTKLGVTRNSTSDHPALGTSGFLTSVTEKCHCANFCNWRAAALQGHKIFVEICDRKRNFKGIFIRI